MAKSKIEWTEYSWNPIVGCSKVSTGCQNCYAEKMAMRLAKNPNELIKNKYQITVDEKGWTGCTRLRREELLFTIYWKGPRIIFVCSMGDLFHQSVPDSSLNAVFEAMFWADQHIYLILTKRAERMRDFVNQDSIQQNLSYRKNFWFGVTAENQELFDKRVAVLNEIKGIKRFVSCEPLLGKIDLKLDENGRHPDYDWGIDWVIVGGESGPKARPMHPDWVRDIRKQCFLNQVPFFFKQRGEWTWWDYKPLPKYTQQYEHADGLIVFRVGKKNAGRLLDGEVYDEKPFRFMAE